MKLMLSELSSKDLNELDDSTRNQMLKILTQLGNDMHYEETTAFNELFDSTSDELSLNREELTRLLQRLQQSGKMEGNERAYFISDPEVFPNYNAEDGQSNSESARLASRIWSGFFDQMEVQGENTRENLDELWMNLAGENREAMDLAGSDLVFEAESSQNYSWQELTAALFLEEEMDNLTPPEEEFVTLADEGEGVRGADGEVSYQLSSSLEDLMLGGSNFQSSFSESAAEGEILFSEANIVDQISSGIGDIKQQDGNSMILQLKPEFLGSVEIEVTVDNGEVIAHLVVENSAVRSELENEIASLQRNLLQEGFDVGEITIEERNNEDGLLQHGENSGYDLEDDFFQEKSRKSSLEEDFQPQMIGRLSSLEQTEVDTVDENVRRWLRWKQYQHAWS